MEQYAQRTRFVRRIVSILWLGWVGMGLGADVGCAQNGDDGIEMAYRQALGTANRYIFSQTGWQDMSPVSEGNAIGGFIEQTIKERDGDRVLHEVKLTDVSVHFLIPEKVHVKQPSDQIVEVPVPIETRAGEPNNIALSKKEKSMLPAIRGILPSLLQVDFLFGLPPLAPNAVKVGDSWTVQDEHVIPTDASVAWNGQAMEHEIASEMTYSFEGLEERPAGFQAQEKVTAMKITGVGTLHSTGHRPDMVSNIDENISVVGYFDAARGVWLEVKHVSESTMKVEGANRQAEGNMGFTNTYILVSSKES